MAPLGNQNALGNEGGRPQPWESVEEIQEKANKYFDNLSKERIPTMTGLASALGVSRITLWRYGGGEDIESRIEFRNALREFLDRVAMAWEERLASPGASGVTFWLKNHGWKDRQEVEHSGTVTQELVNTAELDTLVERVGWLLRTLCTLFIPIS